MKTTIEFLDAIKAKHGIPSDYALAKRMGMRQQTVSKYRLGHEYLGDSAALKVAELLDIDAAYVVACVHRERAKKSDEKQVWETIIEKLGGLAASVVLGLAAITLPMPEAHAASVGAIQHDIHCELYGDTPGNLEAEN